MNYQNSTKKVLWFSSLLVTLLCVLGFYMLEFPSSTLVVNEKMEEQVVIIGEQFPLEGILTRPTEVENPPVLLLVQGSGATDKNATIFLNQPFRDIAHGLAECGIATFRYDRRYFTYPEQLEEIGVQLTLEEEILEDVGYALHYLENLLDLGEIYVLGHSLGGMLSPAIATEHTFVSGIISMNGSPQPLYEISYQQNKASEAYYKENPLDTSTMEEISRQMTQVEQDILTLRGDFSNLPLDTVLMGLPVSYQQSVKEYAGEHYIQELSIPMLILQGGADFQIDPLIDYLKYQSLLENKENVTFHLYPTLNHLMMETQGEQNVTDYYKEQTVSPQVVEDIARFVKSND